MGEHTYSVTCPACDGSITASTLDELVVLVQTHAKENHNKDLSAEQVLEMERQQSES